MRWFKHMTDASGDPFLQYLYRKWGMRGVGWYWLLIEFIAGRGKPINAPCPGCGKIVEISWGVGCSWEDARQVLRTKRATARDFLRSCSAFAEHLLGIFPESMKIILTESSKSKDFLKIECPNILKIKDDHSRKASKDADHVRTCSGVEKKETEKEKEKDKKSGPAATAGVQVAAAAAVPIEMSPERAQKALAFLKSAGVKIPDDFKTELVTKAMEEKKK